MKDLSNLSGRRVWLIPAMVALLSAGLLFVHRVWSGGDNMDYLQMARSAQHGQWADVFGWRFPPGYPALLAGWLTLLQLPVPDNLGDLHAPHFVAAQFPGVVAFAVAAFLCVPWLRALGVRLVPAVLVAALFAANQTIAALSSVIGTDVLVLPLLWGAVWCWERATGEPRSPRWAWAAAGLTIVATTVREVSIVVSLAAIAWVVCTWRARRGHAWLVPAVVPLAFYAVYSVWVRGSSANVQIVASGDAFASGSSLSLVGKVAANLPALAGAVTNLLLPKVAGPFGLLERAGLARAEPILAWALLLVVAAALVLHIARHGWRVSHFFGLGVVAVVVLWPHVVLRYLFPVHPLMLGFLLTMPARREGDAAPWQRGERAAAWLAAALLAWSAATLAFAGLKNVRNIVAFRDLPPWAPERYRVAREDEFADFMQASANLRALVPGDAVVYGPKAPFIELASGRRAAYYALAPTPEALWSTLAAEAEARPCYLLRDDLPYHPRFRNPRRDLLEPLMRDHGGGLERVGPDTPFAVYRVRPPGGS